MSGNARPLLEVSGVTKRYGGIVSVEDVTLSMSGGEILGLIGPNGAGKTTLFNLVSGIVPPTAGEIFLDGRKISNMKPHRICSLGIARTFQSSSLLMGMTVRDNVHIASLFGGPKASAADLNAVTDRALEMCSLTARRNAFADNLTTIERKRVELARAVATGPRLLLTDEILAGLNATESEGILSIIRDLAKSGIGIIFVEHDVRSVMRISDRIVVLAQGRKLAEGLPEEVARKPEVIAAYLGSRYAEH